MWQFAVYVRHFLFIRCRKRKGCYGTENSENVTKNMYPEITKNYSSFKTWYVNGYKCSDYAGYYFFCSHVKIMAAMVMTKVKVLQKHMNPKNIILTRRLTLTLCLLESFADVFFKQFGPRLGPTERCT